MYCTRGPGRCKGLAEQKRPLCCLGTTRLDRSSSRSRAPKPAILGHAANACCAILIARIDLAAARPTARRRRQRAARPDRRAPRQPRSTAAARPPMRPLERRRAPRCRRADARQPRRRGLRPGALQRAGARRTRDPALRRQFEQAAREETDHLAWTRQRLRRTRRPAEPAQSALVCRRLRHRAASPAALGDAVSLGFVVETERQVEQHLDGHLDRLPAGDQRLARDRRADEGRRGAARGRTPSSAGAARLPAPVRWAMRAGRAR